MSRILPMYPEVMEPVNHFACMDYELDKILDGGRKKPIRFPRSKKVSSRRVLAMPHPTPRRKAAKGVIPFPSP